MNWWTPDINPNFNYYEKGRFILIWRISLMFAFVLSILTALNIGEKSIVAFIYGAESIVSIFALIFLYRFKNAKPIFWVFTLSASGFIVYSMYALKHTLHYSDFMWMMCIVLFAFIGLKYKYALIFVGIHLLVIAHFSFFELNEHLSLLRPRTNYELLTVTIEMSFAFVIMSALIYQNIQFQAYGLSELRKTHNALEKQNEENVTLLKEIHHRVKNNLQIVISLLRMQREKIPASETREELDNAMKRVMAISLIHNRLYKSSELSNICFDSYVQGLVSEICSFHKDNREIDVELINEIKNLDMNTMIPLGLIINELVTNSIKHAHESNVPVQIKLKFEKEGDDLINMTYLDNGTWKEQDRNGLGVELIQSLNNQLEGELIREGSAYNIKFKG